jgi:hypothetical protein
MCGLAFEHTGRSSEPASAFDDEMRFIAAEVLLDCSKYELEPKWLRRWVHFDSQRNTPNQIRIKKAVPC